MANETEHLQANPSGSSSGDRLDSWKEIAAYLKCSERTAHRWEAEGLPVHRHPHKKKAAIYAYKAEIDAWWRDGHESLPLMDESQGEAPTTVVPPYRRPWLAAGGALISLLAVLMAFNIGGMRQKLLRSSPAVRIHSLAVLPLENLSRDPEQEYFADGMTDVLISELAQIGSVKVISRTSSMQLQGKQEVAAGNSAATERGRSC
jgi:hypothetical protein